MVVGPGSWEWGLWGSLSRSRTWRRLESGQENPQTQRRRARCQLSSGASRYGFIAEGMTPVLER